MDARSHMPCLVAMLALVSLAAGPAGAATNLNTSRSNNYRSIASAADEQACTKDGGKVLVKDGKKTCELPATPAARKAATPQCDPKAATDPSQGPNNAKGRAKGDAECK